VVLGLAAGNADEVIRELGEKLLQAGFVRASFVEAALARERMIPTGLPLGGEYNAAIPHTDVEHVIKSGVGLATLQQPVNFHNMLSPEEIVAVRLVFVLALDRPKSQVKMLQGIAAVLQDPQRVAALVHAAGIGQVRQALQTVSG
jgi:PTS system galactitol-specific IIA component